MKRVIESLRGSGSNKIKQVLILIGTFMAVQASFANPVLDNVASGNVSVQQTSSTTQVQQNSSQAIINWQSFNIGAGEHTHFQQPVGGVALNRINPQQGASQIFGQLTATGRIILVNQAGIFFGPGSRVDVGGIIASTSNISDANFLAGKYVFDQPSAFPASIINQGSIKAADYGLVALMGSNVINQGVIQAKLGNVVLASGNKFTVDLYGDELINFTVDEASTGSALDSNGATLKDAVNNSGTIVADGGTILMTAKTAAHVVDNVINMSGITEASSIENSDGQIILAGDDQGTVTVTGTLNASGNQAGQKGGTIQVTGANLIAQNALFNVSGDQGGGTIFFGGNFHGQGPLLNSSTVYVDPNSRFLADAITQGNGGQIAVWSNDATQFYGNISATGGALGGNGGYVETSGGYLDVNGSTINLSAAHGTVGSWLLDPYNLDISTGSTTATGTGSSGNPYTSNSNSVLNSGTLTTALGSADVYVQTGAGGDITLDANVGTLTWSSASTLNLNSGNNIYLNSNITAVNGGLTLNAASGAQSLTAGTIGSGTSGSAPTSVTAAIDVNNFTLGSGQWLQNANSLPAFTVNNDFEITAGSTYNNMYAGQFTRINSTGGVNGIQDVYGLQGIGTSDLTASYSLTGNIDASGSTHWNSGAGFIPIGNANTGIVFIGNFDGNNYTISGLTINNSSLGNAGVINSNIGLNSIGMFGDVGDGFTPVLIQNLTLLNSVIHEGSFSGASNIGFLAGTITGPLETDVVVNNVTISGGSITYNNTSTIGSLVGNLLSAEITNISNNASIVDNGGGNIGGILGIGGSVILSGVTNAGAITSGSGGVGGLIGGLDSDATITNSSNSGPIINNALNSEVGGLIGEGVFGSFTITNSFNIGNVTITGGSNTDWGGLVGVSGGTSSSISNSYNAGTLLDQVGGNRVGGLVGNANDIYGSGPLTITNSYNSGNITGPNEILGGLIGWSTEATISSSYNTGNLTATAGTGINIVGGLIADAQLYTNDFLLSNSYNTGTITTSNATSGDIVGGLVGLMGTSAHPGTINQWSQIQSSFNTGNISATSPSAFVGGLVGTISGNGRTNVSVNLIETSFNSGSITVSGTSSKAGGIVGEAVIGGASVSNTLTDVDNLGAVVNSSGNTGGLVGYSDLVTVNTSFNAGYVNGGTAGGLVGNGTAATINSSYWDSSTSGQANSYSSGTTGALDTATFQSDSLATLGFTSGNWGSAANMYPYLTAIYSTTPTVVSGILSGTAGSTVQLVDNGTQLTSGATSLTNITSGTVTAGANGYYYFLESNGALADNDDVLTYVSAGTSNGVGNITNGSASQLGTAAANTISVGSAAMSNTDLVTALGGLGGTSGITYTAPSSSLLLPSGINFATTSGTTYTITGGTLGANTLGSINFVGPVLLPAATSLHTTGDITFGSTIDSTTSTAENLTLNSGGSINFNGDIGDTNPLAALSVTAATATNLGTINVATTGDQTFNGPVVVESAATANLTSGGNVLFNSTIDGTSGTETLNIAGSAATTFLGDIGDTVPLQTLSVTSTGATTFGANTASQINVNADNQTYNGAVVLAGTDNTLTDLFNFNQDGNFDTINFANGLSSNGVSANVQDQEVPGTSGAAYHIGGNGTINMSGGTLNFIGNGQNYDALYSDMTTAQTWDISGSGGTFASGAVNFTNFYNVSGSNNGDTFNVASMFAVSFINGINGGKLDVSSLSGAEAIDLYSITGTQAQGHVVIGFNSLPFAFMSQIIGNDNVGSNVNDTSAVNETWTVTGSHAFTETSGPQSLSYSGLPIINTSGGATDRFVFQSAGSITNLNAGSGGLNILDYSGYGSASSVNLQTGVASGISSGSFNINEVIGDATSFGTLTGVNAANTWTLTGANAGSVTGLSHGFTNISNLVGGTANNTFIFPSTGSVASVDGGVGGINTLDYSDYGSAISVNLQTALATGITSSFTNINNVIGDTTALGTLTGANVANTWTITGTNAGSVTGLSNGFTNIANLAGGAANDTFTFQSGGAVANVTGGATGASVDASALSGSTNIALTGAGSSAGLNGTSTVGMTSFNNITSFAANNNAASSVTGVTGLGETWSITGPSAFSLTALSKSSNFSGFPIINGSAAGGFDTFNFASNVFGGTINGGGHSNTFNFSNSTIGATVVGGSGDNSFIFSPNNNYSGSIISGSGNNAYIFGDSSTYSGTLAGAGTSTLVFRAYTTPITIAFTSVNNGTVLNNTNGTIVSFTNFNSATANETGAQAYEGIIELPTSNTANVLQLNLAAANQGVAGSFNDPFTFGGFNNFVGQSSGIDQINFSGFTASSGGTVNGVPIFYSGFSTEVVPPAPPPPTPPPSAPAVSSAQISVAISATAGVMTGSLTTTPESNSSGSSKDSSTIGMTTLVLPAAIGVSSNITTMVAQQNTADVQISNSVSVNLGCQ